MASSEDVDNAKETDKEKSLTILIGDNKEVFYDQDVMQNIMASNQSSTHVTIVRMGQDAATDDVSAAAVASASAAAPEEFVSTDAITLDVTQGAEGDQPPPTTTGAVTDAAVVEADQGLESLIMEDPSVSSADPIMMLDQDQISRLENVLQSAEAKDMLGIPEEAVVADEEGLVDIFQGEALVPMDQDLETAVEEAPSVTNSKGETTDEESSSSKGPPKRRSQRQIDREMKEEAERIRQENQALMKKEREEARKLEASSEDEKKEEPKPPQGRPKRERKIPAHLKSGDYESSFVTQIKKTAEKKEEEEEEPQMEEVKDEMEAEEKPQVEATAAKDDDEDDEESDDNDWNSEDDPDRLWCVCKQPHNNRFMICCDTCLDWYHGKCVGITKSMGKDMEAAGNEWRCPKCKKNEEEAREAKVKEGLVSRLKEREEEKKAKDTAPAVSPGNKKKGLKRSDSKGEKTELEKPKPKEKTCHVCEKPPRSQSIYCSEKCITAHASKARVAFSKDKGKAKPADAKGVKVPPTNIMVMDPMSNTILNGPSAPNDSNLESWLLKHPTYHVVMPTSNPTSKFYGSKQRPQPSSRSLKLIPPPRQNPTDQKLVDKKLAEYKSSALSSLTAARQILQSSLSESAKKDIAKKEAQEAKRHLEKRKESLAAFYGSGSSKSSVPAPRHRKESSSSSSVAPARRQSSVVKGEMLPAPAPPPVNPKPIRDNASKGIEDALRTRVEKSGDLTYDKDKMKALVKEIEEELFRLYNKDVGPKYKAKYRSLVFNIKDEKNNGLFRKIVSAKISPRSLVNMTADEMASKELQQWRQAELKNDIEKIKSHELDILARGTKYVLKSHKGEQVIEEEEGGKVSKIVAPVADLKLPDEMKNEEEGEKRKDEFASWGAKTWEHGEHAFESTCDVCTGKKTLDELILAKAKKKEERRRREKERQRRKDKERKRHHSKDHHHSSSRDKHHKSSRSEKDHKSSKSDKDHKSSKSDKDHKSSRSDKERHRSSRDDERKEGEKDKSKSERRNSSSHHHKSSSRDKRKSSSSSSHKDSSSTSSRDREEKAKIVEEKKRKEEMEKEEEERKKSFSEKVAKAEKILSAFSKSKELPTTSMEDEPGTPPNTPPLQSSSQEEVSSTVHITTPESVPFTGDKANPTVWKGDLDMPDVARFAVTAQAVSGTTDYLTVDLRETLKIVGRIPHQTVWDYIVQVAEMPSKEILLIRLQPTTAEEKVNYDSFYAYLKGRNRIGVVGNNSKMVKDCYILPLEEKEEIPKCLLPLDGPGLEEERQNMLLAIIVRTRRKRPGDVEKSVVNISLKKKKLDEPIRKAKPAMVTIEDEEEGDYDPAMAGSNLLIGESSGTSPDDDDDVYDPESAFEVEAPAQKKVKYSNENPQFSPPGSPEEAPKQHAPITSSGGGFTEQLAKLTKAIEKQKAEIASMGGAEEGYGGDKDQGATAGFQGLPSTIANILFGAEGSSSEPAPSSSSKPTAKSLSSMSDADLLLKAQEMEGKSAMSHPPPTFQPQSIPMYPGSIPPPPTMNQFNQPAGPQFNSDWMRGPPPMPPRPSHPPGPWMQGFEPQQGGMPVPPAPPGAWQQRGFQENREAGWRDRGGGGDNWRDRRHWDNRRGGDNRNRRNDPRRDRRRDRSPPRHRDNRHSREEEGGSTPTIDE